MMAKNVNLFVGAEFVVPDVYTKGTMEEVEEALWIGANIQQSIRTRRSSEEVKKIVELKDSEIARIQGMYNEKLTKLLDDIRVVTAEKDRISVAVSEGVKEARMTEREVVGREWEEKLRALRREHEILGGRYEALEARRRELEESRSRDIQGICAFLMNSFCGY